GAGSSCQWSLLGPHRYWRGGAAGVEGWLECTCGTLWPVTGVWVLNADPARTDRRRQVVVDLSHPGGCRFGACIPFANRSSMSIA
ncbi:hypothetical protein HPP92_011312, partial [Vanilla planifolia]